MRFAGGSVVILDLNWYGVLQFSKIRPSGRRFLPPEVDRIRSITKLGDVKLAIQQIETQLAATQRLRNLGRILPFIDALGRFSQAVEVACNGTDYLPWIWAPIKFILLAVQDHAHALDKVLTAYADIGSKMPRFAIYANAFPTHESFQQMIAYLFEDILEFHRKAYSWITKPGLSMFFTSVWGRFNDRFDTLLQSIACISEKIDRDAVAIDIMEAAELRKKWSADCIERDRRHHIEQLQSILNWLERTEPEGDAKLDVLLDKHLEGTSHWALQNSAIRSWLQIGGGGQVLWINGKPGSGKSVLCARLIKFLRDDPNRRVCFFICDFQTPSQGICTHILRSIASQLLRLVPDAVSYVYNEYVGKSRRPTSETLKPMLGNIFSLSGDIRLVVDGIDEIAPSEHRNLLKTLLDLTKSTQNLKLLLVSQDIPTIAQRLSKQSKLRMSEEKGSIEKDMGLIIRDKLEDITELYGDQIAEDVITKLESDILKKAEGMYLWVHLVMDLLQNAPSVHDLLQQVHELPSSLKELYARILNNITSYSKQHLPAIRRLFAWLICNKGKQPLSKHMLRLGMILRPDYTVIDRTTRPLANATDICKPLIEEGQGNSLVFVHSTVPHTPNEKEIDIALELYALVPYAQQYWTTHLLACLGFDAASHQLPELSKLLSQTERLTESLRDLEKASETDDSASNGSIKVDPILLEFLSPSSALVIARHTQTSPDTELQELPLARSCRLYRRILQSLVAKRALPGLTDSQFLAFKAEYKPTAFMCDTSGCGNAVRGFSSHDLLRNHEARHSQPLRCPEAGCGYDLDFRTPYELRKHTRKRHPSSIEAPVPKRLRSHNPLICL
ncbi:hypothetical protein PG985_014876 [Apiospora marii]|uniref:uncharacterized protein n=1 Tax=Apiospora marii TaxID=335849 RepID=UPI0031315FCB